MAENTEKILYQLYKPKLKECATFALHIGISSQKTCCLTKLYMRYSVTVCYHYVSGKKKEYLTSKIWAPWSAQPNWNEDFTFNILMENDSSKYKEGELEFKLKAIPFLGPVYEVATGKFKLHQIFDTQLVKLTGGIKINVEFTEGEKRIPDVRIRDQYKLCDEEVKFCKERKNVIHKSKAYQNIQNKEGSDLKDVPNIALIGSGGGMRAVQGMCGAMIALQESQILDLAMYTAGVSGSSWYISTLYTSSRSRSGNINPVDVKTSIQTRVNGVWQEIKSVAKALVIFGISQFCHTGKYRTATDVFGNVIGDILLKEKKNTTWSSQTTKLTADALPLLAMLQVYDKNNPEELNEWVECSPYEAFMPKYGTGINMQHFGSEFDGGFVTKKYPEQPVHVLQGVCGSAYIDELNPDPNGTGRCCSFRNNKWVSFLKTITMTNLENKFVGKIPNWFYGVSQFDSLFEGKDLTNEDGYRDNIKSMKKVIDEKNKELMLTDAGILFNSPYPTVLHPGRKIDLILSFEFSAPDSAEFSEWPFSELRKAEKWAKCRNIPFPDLSMIDNYKTGPIDTLYVFRDELNKAPTIMHFVMYDKSPDETRRECESKVDKMYWHAYKTLKFWYSNEEFDRLSNLMKTIVQKKVDEIKQEIAQAVKKRSNEPAE